ncbi:pyruvate kinase [Paenibacillus sp. J2TS4]|nr:pyruvate kinase [Paenibacillus sp. J2TS4]
MRKTKILCTLGPSCDTVPVLKEMIQAGMNIARLNMAHGEPEDQIGRIRNLRQAAAELNAIIPIMLDIKGPEIRIGSLHNSSYSLVRDSKIILTTEQIIGDSKRVSVTYQRLPDDVKPNTKILIDDGLIELCVDAIEEKEIHCRIVHGGTLKPRKSVNLPGIKTDLPAITKKDVRHILFGIEHNLEMIAASFVRKAEDIIEIRRILEENNTGHIQIISKIENEEGVRNLEDIINVSDGIMVARGDLGVEIPVEDVPMVQTEMVEKCQLAGKPVIIATHMLESMQFNPRPTRAEVSDVATAVLQGADVLMLSGESAVGQFPVESVTTMASVAEKAEIMFESKEISPYPKAGSVKNMTEIISQSVVSASIELGAAAIITPTESGTTARMVAKYRPRAPILAITQHDEVLPRLCLLRGVVPVKGNPVTTTDEMFESAIKNGLQTGLIRKGDFIVISAGVPIGEAGRTNLMKVQQI